MADSNSPEEKKQTSSKKPDPNAKGSQIVKTVSAWLLIFLLSIGLYQIVRKSNEAHVQEITYSEFLDDVDAGKIKEVTFIENEVHGKWADSILLEQAQNSADTTTPTEFKSYVPSQDVIPDIVERLRENKVKIHAKPETRSWWTGVLISWSPLLLLVLFWIFFMRQMQGGGRGVFSFGKSRAKLFNENQPRVTFNDVAGATEAKQELQEIIDFLKAPEKFRRLGGRIPKGALLLGPPGTGKTLLAKAVAGEAGVPFFSTSGSDFLEMFVGVGASRVRDLFEQGKKNAPCIIFIDELDAVGRHRGAGLGGGHDEREQTLNQLLTEMDGFESSDGVIIVAATNRPDVLDPALLRPGRFDRQVVVDRPDVKGREGILEVHTRKIPLSKDVDLKTLAKGTPGFSGAELANMVNEAALLAARRDHDVVTMADMEDAKDKIMMGLERKSLVISDEEKKTTAYHEAGHALVAKLLPGMDPVHKVTIIPRGRALGVTHYLPIDERHTYSKEYVEYMLASMMGGRAAELIVFNQLTTGASNDIERATEIARKMVCEWGMSDELGPLTFGKKEEEIFLGREIATHRDYSESTAIAIDKEVRRIVTQAHDLAINLLKEHIDVLHGIAQALLERETIDSEDIDHLLANHKSENPENGTNPISSFSSDSITEEEGAVA
ncbi:MAG: ATP-dependent metallopeptidase FtsH/Yme1/Tma family protein [Gemmatimonadetes bacterium]|nr:MAG: ATP-dependent metallopeptidase FtsH/Yme1/Tma family protein [Gemmatimonadota bacterium]